MPAYKDQINILNISLIPLICLTLSACGSAGSSTSSSSSSSSARANSVPMITGTPDNNISENRAYSFIPVVSDSDQDALVFSITNKPSWATFNTATGQLTGNPTTGVYNNVVISVSDGTVTSSLPAFTINVLGSAVLNWSKPTLNTDGTTLTDLTGYIIYYGTSPNASELTNSITISNGDTTTATIEDLSTGTTYYFAVASESKSGGVGKKSNPASKTIN